MTPGAAPTVDLHSEVAMDYSRCWCGHPVDAHRHYRPGHDCGSCGVIRCHRYVGRDQQMPWSHAEAAAVNDAHLYRNLALLSPFAQSSRHIAAARIPRQRTATVVGYLEARRARARKGGQT